MSEEKKEREDKQDAVEEAEKETVAQESAEEETAEKVLDSQVSAEEETALEQTKNEKDKNDKEGKEEEKKPLSKRILSGVTELLLYVMIALVCIFVIPKYVVQRTEVSGPSMESTLQDEDNILVEKLSYRFGEPKRFDIVIFYHFFEDEENYDNPDWEKSEDYHDKSDEDSYDFYVKRIIGLPGETVQIKGETIYINGEPLEENYGKDPITYQGVASKPITLGADEYFVLGDNREVSKDSRYPEVGNVKKELIVGKAWLRVYPFNKIGFLSH